MTNSHVGRWVTVGSDVTNPVTIGRDFDLAFGPDQLPVLVSIDKLNPALNLRKWDGQVWTGLLGGIFSGENPQRVRTAYDWAGTIVVGLLLESFTSSTIRVYVLRDSGLRQLGPALQIASQPSGLAVAIDARGPVVAWLANGFVVVKRWDAANWVQLGSNVNEQASIFMEAQSPALAVTGDGKLVVAYTMPVGQATVIEAKAWNGTSWVTLGDGVPPSASSPSLGGENSGAPIVAFRSGLDPRVSRWNGSTWTPSSRPFIPPVQGRTFGFPSLTVRGSQPLVICGILYDAVTVLGSRMLVGRALSDLSGWEALGSGTINGQIALPDDNELAYVVRSDPGGRPWVAWTAKGGAASHVIVSTLGPPEIGAQP